MKRAILAATILTMAALAGCEVYDEPGPPVVDGPVVYDTYYWGGYYDGPYWVYRDHYGHWYHERREEHERLYEHHYGHREHFEGRAEHGYRGGEHFGGHEGGHIGGGHEGGGHDGHR